MKRGVRKERGMGTCQGVGSEEGKKEAEVNAAYEQRIVPGYGQRRESKGWGQTQRMRNEKGHEDVSGVRSWDHKVGLWCEETIGVGKRKKGYLSRGDLCLTSKSGKDIIQYKKSVVLQNAHRRSTITRYSCIFHSPFSWTTYSNVCHVHYKQGPCNCHMKVMITKKSTEKSYLTHTSICTLFH